MVPLTKRSVRVTSGNCHKTKMSLIWVPENKEVQGNDKTDLLAKQSSMETFKNPVNNCFH